MRYSWAERPLRSRYSVLLVTAALGTFFTFAAFLLVSWWEYRVAEIEFESRAKTYLEFINADLGDARTLLYTIAAFIEAQHGGVTRREFAQFSLSLHRRLAGVRDTAWAPHVMLADRSRFERDARAGGVTGFEIRQFGRRQQLTRAALRPDYFPLLYVDAAAGAKVRGLLGFDLISERHRAAAALRALKTHEPAATPPIDVLTVPTRGGGVLSYMPVYSTGSPGVRPDADVRGLVLGVFDIHALVANILARHPAVGSLQLYLFNPAAPAQRRVLYTSASRNAKRSEQAMLSGAHWQSSVVVIDQPIGAIVTPEQPLRLLRPTLFGVVTLVLGFAMTGMIVAFLRLSVRRTAQLESLTADLQAATRALHADNEKKTAVALHDALTGLANRLLFTERMDQAIARFKRGAPFTLFFLDLDRFKLVNDTLGHSAGDRLLCAAANRITSSIREVDTAARLGGDEFAVVLSEVADHATIAMLANRLIEKVRQPYTIDGHQVEIGVSIGAAVAMPGVTAAGLVAQADLAMYAAKAAGRGTFRVFEARMTSQVVDKRLLEADLERALANGEVEVLYEPLVDLARDQVAALEACVRWNHPSRGVLLADAFFPVAAACGLMARLGEVLLQTAISDAVSWPQALKVAVHLPPALVNDAALVTTLMTCLERSGLPGSRLEIEIDEAALLAYARSSLALLTHLRTLGVGITLADFGTGASSLSSLLHFPFDKIKIHRSLLTGTDASPDSVAIVRAVVSLASNLNLVTIGHGIETQKELEELRRCGCLEAQGPVFGAPRPKAEIAALLSEFDSRATVNAQRF